jgi:hypothetical protein
MRQRINPHETVLLLRGRDHFGHFAPDVPAIQANEPAAVARHAELDRLRKATGDASVIQRSETQGLRHRCERNGCSNFQEKN